MGVALVYAATQISHNKSTGLFAVQSEGPASEVVLYNAATGALDPTWSSCAAPTLANGQTVHCLLEVKNLRVGGSIRYSLRLTYSGDVALANALNVTVAASSLASCTGPATGGIEGSGQLSTPGGVGFGDPAPGNDSGDRVVPAGGSATWCIRAVYTAGPGTFNTSLSGQLTVVADDTGLE
jgi:hypothetical protein